MIDALWAHERVAEAKEHGRNALDACVVAASRLASSEEADGSAAVGVGSAEARHELLRKAIEMAERLVEEEEASVPTAQVPWT